MALLVRIGYPDGNTQTTLCEQPAVVIGSGPAAQVVVTGAAEVLASHLLVMPKPEGCWLATSRDANVFPLYKGKAFENGIVAYGDEIDLGSITVTLLRPTVAKQRSRLRLALIGLPIVIAFALFAGQSNGLPRTNAAPPALFDEAQGTCREPARASAVADEMMSVADSMELRYAYDPVEGIRAVARYQEAERCALAAQEQARATEAQRRRRQLELRIDGDFRSLRIRLERARVNSDAAAMLSASHAMRAYLAFRPGPYRSWLEAVERHVSTQIESQGRKR